MSQVEINIAEAIICSAVIENHDEELRQLEEDKTSISFSEAHEKRMNRLFNRTRVKRSAIRVWAVTRRVATAAAFLIAILSALLMFNPRVQAAVSEIVTEFFTQFTSFRFNSSSEETTGEIEWVLGWLPESFNETYREYDEGYSRAGYTDADGITIRFTAMPAETREINVDNEHSEYSVKSTDGIEYHIFASNTEEASSIIIWVNSGYSFSLSSYCAVDILEMVAYSVCEAGK